MVLSYQYVVLHFHAGFSDNLLCIYHGLSEPGTLPAPGIDPANVLHDKRDSEAFGNQLQRQDFSEMAGKCRHCGMLPDHYRRHNRNGIYTGTSRVFRDRTGTGIVPVLSLYGNDSEKSEEAISRMELGIVFFNSLFRIIFGKIS
jgi:hypothetical protein